MGPAKREYRLTGHTPNPPRQRRHESFPCLFSQSECRQWSEEKTSMGVIFLLQSSKEDSAKKNPDTFGGSCVQRRARGGVFHAEMASSSVLQQLPCRPHPRHRTHQRNELMCPLMVNMSVDPHSGQGKITSGMVPPPQPRTGWRLLSGIRRNPQRSW